MKRDGKLHTFLEEETAEEIKAISEGQIIQKDGVTALLPIKSRGKILGGIRIIKNANGGEWNKEEIQLAETLAEQLSIALESARLFDQSQRRATRERVIGETSARIRETLDIESVLETAAQELHKILGKVETEVWLDAEEHDGQTTVK